MNILDLIAERRIAAAVQRGELDNLSLQGQPLQLADLRGIPGPLRSSYLLLKNAGYVPEEVEVRRGLCHVDQLLRLCVSEERRRQLRQQRGELTLRLDLLQERRQRHSSAGRGATSPRR